MKSYLNFPSHFKKAIVSNVLLLWVFVVLTVQPVAAQLVKVTPETPKLTDQIHIIFDASKGNQALIGEQGTVFFHAGLITSMSRDERDWKFVVGNWGVEDKKVEMKKIGENLFTASFVPKNFFGLADDIKVNQIAFVFRNANGSKVGKTSENTDIYIDIEGFKPIVEKKSEYLFKEQIFKGHRFENETFIVETSQGDITFRPFGDSIIETIWHPNGLKSFEPSHAVVKQPSNTKGTVAETTNKLIFDWPGFQVLVQKKPFKISYLRDGVSFLDEATGFFARTDAKGVRFALTENEMLFGSGGRTSGINLRGKKLGLYNRPDYNYVMGANDLNYMIPLLVSSKKYLLFFDNPQKAYFDIDSQGDGVLEFGAIGGPMKYFVIVSKSIPSLIQHYASLTGLQPMLPRWAFGNLQSRMAYRTQKETVEIVDKMLAADFPIDAIILDFYWFGDSILGHLGRLDWWKPNWPNPEKMIADFRSKGIKTITISEPYIIDTLANWKIANNLGILAKDKSGNAYIDKQFYFGNGSLIDIFKPEAQQWLWKQYRKQFDIGVEGLWGDLGEPESHPSDMVHVLGMANEVHNIYGHYWSKMIFEGFRNDFPKQRLFFLARSGFAGTQRYGIVPWTGDVSRSWEGLQAQIPAMLNMSLSGVPYIHSDAGGFAQGVKDEELYTRWLQFAVFTPILRPHGSGIPSEPIFFNDTTQRIVRHFMKLRYELLPYIYTNAWLNSINGTPITVPTFFYHPHDDRFNQTFKSYFFGENLLVFPIVENGLKRMEVELPNGNWYHFWTGSKIRGGGKVNLLLALESIPVFARAGSIIPRVDPMLTTDAYTSRKLFLHAYLPDGDKAFTGKMFEDDGSTFGTYESDDYELLKFDGHLNNGAIELSLSKSGNGYIGMPESRLVEIIFYGLEKNLKEAKFEGKKLNYLDARERSSFTPGYWKDENDLWHIKFIWTGNNASLKAK